MRNYSKTVLTINTTQTKQVSVSITSEDIEDVCIEKYEPRSSQIVLLAIEEAIGSAKKKLQDITEIRVHTGPGSFTGIRVGIAVAQSLGKLFTIPVLSERGGAITPRYGDNKWDTP